MPEELLLLVQQLLDAALAESRSGDERLAATVTGLKTRLADIEDIVLMLGDNENADDRIIRHYVLLQALRDARLDVSNAAVAVQSRDHMVQRVEDARDALQELMAWQLRSDATANTSTGPGRELGAQPAMAEERELFDQVRQPPLSGKS
jgi:hypothetical protein